MIPEEEVQRASPDLDYEERMFIATARLLESEDWEEDHKRALLESFLIHFRNLWDFMCKHSSNPDDVLAIDFLRSEDKLLDLREHVPGRLKELHDRAHKMVAHLTYTRSTLEEIKKSWPVSEIANDIVGALRRFESMRPAADR